MKYSLHIETEKTRPGSPYVFGHNLEHTRACVSGGLSAQMLRNRKFAGRPATGTGVSAEWTGIGERVFFCNDRDPYVRHYRENGMWRRNETNAQTVQNPLEGETAGIMQNGLCFLAGTRYTAAFVAKSSCDTEITVRFTDRTGKAVYAQETFPIHAGGWQRCEKKLTCAVSDDDACIRFTFTTRASVVFGAVSLMPEDHFHGMRRDVVALLKELGAGMLRWPGGNFAGEYRWQDMFLPVDMRAPLQAFTEDETQPYTHGYDMHEIDTDSFIALCREIGAEPFITLNLFWDDPDTCAAWVEYCNGDADSKYGKLRAERSHPEPYNVRFWSLGNEMGYGHMEGPMQPAQYAAMAKEAAGKMLAVCPGLTLCSSGPYERRDAAEEWIKFSAKALLPEADFISFHTYNGLPYDFTSPQGIRTCYDAAIRNVHDNHEKLKTLRALMPDDIHISYDEWNLWASWFRQSNALEGMFAACMQHMLLTAAADLDVPIVCYFQPVNEGAVRVNRKNAVLTANGQVFSLMKAHKGGALCAVQGADAYDAAASVRENILTLTVINTAFDEPAAYTVNRCGTPFRSALLTADDLLPGSVFKEGRIDYSQTNEQVSFTLPPRSVGAIRFRLSP